MGTPPKPNCSTIGPPGCAWHRRVRRHRVHRRGRQEDRQQALGHTPVPAVRQHSVPGPVIQLGGVSAPRRDVMKALADRRRDDMEFAGLVGHHRLLRVVPGRKAPGIGRPPGLGGLRQLLSGPLRCRAAGIVLGRRGGARQLEPAPCQDFSRIGQSPGHAGQRGALFLATAEFYWKTRSLLPDRRWVFLFENVVMEPAHSDAVSKALGVDPIMVCASDFGWISRPRLWWLYPSILQATVDPASGKPLQWAKHGSYRRLRLEEPRQPERACGTGAAVTTIRAFPSGSAFFTAAATAAGSSEVRSPRCRSHGSLSLVSLMQASSISHANAARACRGCAPGSPAPPQCRRRRTGGRSRPASAGVSRPA